MHEENMSTTNQIARIEDDESHRLEFRLPMASHKPKEKHASGRVSAYVSGQQCASLLQIDHRSCTLWQEQDLGRSHVRSRYMADCA